MLPGIFSVLSVGLGILFWILKRRASQAGDPAVQNRLRYEQIDKDIASALQAGGDSKSASLDCAAHAGADLDELDRMQRGHGDQRRPD